MCDDMEQKLVQWVYYFAFRLEDEEGDLIDVVICDEGVRSVQIHMVSTDDLFHVAPSQKHFLSGLPPSDLSEGDNLDNLRSRLAGLLGNLIEVHEGLKCRKRVDPKYGPYQDFAMKSWRISEGRKSMITYAITGSRINL